MKQLHWNGVLLAALLSCALAVQALDKKAAATLVSQFQSLPAADLPAAAALAVRRADETVRAEVSGLVVTTIAARDPAALPPTVIAILGVQPSLAPIIVPLGAQRVPEAATNLLAITSRLAPAFAKQTADAVVGVLGATRVTKEQPPGPATNPTGPVAPVTGSSQTRAGTIQGQQPASPPTPVLDPKPSPEQR